MDVLYTCDNNYVWLMGISTISLFENNQDIDNLTVYLLGENIGEENRKALAQIAEKYNRKIIVNDVPEIDIPESLISARWPLSAFTRLYSGQLLPQNVEKVLYLDCDTVINGSISELESTDISGNLVYGVKDCIGGPYKKNIGLKSDDIYINAGVLLFNLKKLRRIDIKNAIDQCMAHYETSINYADQDILNSIFVGNIGVLHPRYNVMTIDVKYTYHEIKILRNPTNFYRKEELIEAIKDPVIIHYTTNMEVIRPWFMNATHPLTKDFLKYSNISPWSGKEQKKLQFSTKETVIIRIIMRLPKPIALRILGFIHAKCKPFYIWLKSKRRK